MKVHFHRKKSLVWLLFITMGMTFSPQSVQSQTDVYLEIYARTFQRLEIDLYPVVGQSVGRDSEVLTGMISEVLKNDLWMSGYFKINLKQGTPPLPTNDRRTDGASGKALAYVSGTFRVHGDDVSIVPVLADRNTGKTILRKEFNGSKERGRYLVHKIADDIVFRLTGEGGIARTKIAYVRELQNSHKEIALMDYDGYHPKTITSDKSIDLSPAWSPDGSQICYLSFKEDNPNLFIYNLKTRKQFKISGLPGLNASPAWSPDGEKIALTLSKDGNAEIYLLQLEKKNYRRLTYNRAIDASPAWSPSNQEIVFTSDRSGSPQVYIMDADGLNTRRLTWEGSYNDSPVWSPRGDKIAYVSRTDSGFDIYTIDVDGENRMRLTDSSGSNEDPAWSPNGYSLIFSSTRSGQKTLYSMFWDGSDQKQLTSDVVSYLPAWSRR